MVQYCRPQTVDEALQVLATAEGAGRILVGGTDLLVGVRRNPLEPLVLVDLKTASDLPAAIEILDDSVRFGPTATMSTLSNPLIKAWYPALVQASRVVGSVAIRNRATLIGNICNASPAADTAPALLIYGAIVTIVGPGGERTIPLSDFFIGPGQTACGDDELVIGLELFMPHDNDRSSFERLTRRRGVDLATVSVAARFDEDNRITLGLGAVGPTPLLTETSVAVDAEDDEAIDDTVAQLVSVATPISDVRAGRDYRVAMTEVLAKRAVRNALGSAPGDGGTGTI